MCRDWGKKATSWGDDYWIDKPGQIYLTVWEYQRNMGGLENPPFFLSAGIRPFRFNLRKSILFTENSREIYMSFIIVCYNIYTERKREEINTYGY